MTVQLTNCKNCMKDKHDKCTRPETCLCANDKHGFREPSLKDGVKVSNDKVNKKFIEDWNEVNQEIRKENLSVTSKEVDIFGIAQQIMLEYKFITLEGMKVKEILFYNDGIFREFGEDIISKRSRKLNQQIRNHHISEIKGIIRDETGYYNRDVFDKESFIVNMKNKTFNLKTGEIKDHTPEYLSRVKIPVYYDPDAKCPRFDKFLESSLENDEQKIRTILEMMALCLIKDNGLVQKAFMNTGKGSNGKSILFGILYAMLGKKNLSAKTIHDFEKNRFAGYSLENKLANICADVGNKGIVETEALKKIISGDPIDSERKFFDSYPFEPYSTLIFSANEIPEVSDESDGFARRFELIEWEKSFYGKDRDNSIKTIRHTPSELSGIFNKISVIAKKLLQSHSLKYESTVEDAKLKWLMKSDTTHLFLDKLTARGQDYFCSVPVIFSNYNKFCKDKGLTPLNDRRFNAKLEKLGLERKTKRMDKGIHKVWVGLTMSNLLTKDNQSL